MYFTLLLLPLILCQNIDSQINQYVDEINEFMNRTSSWRNPGNNRAYLEGNSEFQPGIYVGTFDFIVVGAGTSGSVIINRLTEVENWNVLALEAGDFPSNVTDIPILAEYLRLSEYNWGYTSEPQPNISQAYINQTMKVPRGRVVGGTSVINAMIYTKGNRRDYDRWASLGNPGWDFENVLPYFRRSESASIINPDFAYHGFQGPVHVENNRIFDETGFAFLEANRELGRPIVDFNGRRQLGSGLLQMNEINGRRDSAEKSYIRPILKRPNLTFRERALAARILINPNNRRAYGVRYARDGFIHYAIATREVIVSAGSINSPQLLMLSGVGPRSHLQSFGIPCLSDRPVGENMWDHMIVNSQAFSINHTFNYPNERELLREYHWGMGFLTSPVFAQGMVFLNSRSNSEVPNLEHVFHSGKPPLLPYEYFRDVHGYTREAYDSTVVPLNNINNWYVHTVLLHPQSRGWVRLRSNSPFDYPSINLNYFSDNRDLETFLDGMRDVSNIANTAAMQRLNSTIIPTSLPACNVYTRNTDDFWRCMIVNLVETVYHNAGTCKMGPVYDRTAVVDPFLRVHGIRGLRVADASVIPVTISGHINSVAFMIGEKAADLIKYHYRYSG